ncbi:MAG: tyrosine-protein phosphatase [Aquabacterium sp.]
MAFRILPLPPDMPGHVWLDAMPGRFERWPVFLDLARQHRLDLIVCLAERPELARLSPDYDRAVSAGQLPCRWLHLPIRDFGIPEAVQGYRDGVLDVATAVRRGESVLLHCAAGIGRTGTTAACLLKALGLSVAQALRDVRSAGSSPESAGQSGLIDRF